MPSSRLREQDLAGKVAVVTGASRGIGRAIAMNLASRGCSILGTCSSSKTVHFIDVLENEIAAWYEDANQKQSSKVKGISADIFSPLCAQTIADGLVKHFAGRVDIYVNNASDSGTGELGELTVDEIQKSMVGNIQTPVLIVDELVKRKMFRPESRIVYISSIRSRQPWSMQLMYAAGKSAGESLCRTWSQAFGGSDEKVGLFCYFQRHSDHPIVIFTADFRCSLSLLIYVQFSFMAGTTANAVTVGLTQTDSVMQCPPDVLEEFKQEFMPLQSIPKLGQPEDVAVSNTISSILDPFERLCCTNSVIFFRMW
jgi:NAD(P)-dependent dehydrogenase (short-subunit alcohol dehydrogenase family)